MRRGETLALLQKELYEIFRSPALLASMASLPLTTVAVPLAVASYLVRAAPEATVAFLAETYQIVAPSPRLALTEAVATLWLPIFLIMPVFIPILIAAQSVAGERERGTLEALLAAPISTLSVVLAKSLAAVTPAVAITWAAALAFRLGLGALGGPGSEAAFGADWWLAIGAVAPLLATFGNTLAVLISIRLADARAAQNFAAMSVVPIVGLVVARLAGGVEGGPWLYGLWALALIPTDLALIVLAARAFSRERLLTRA